MGHKTVVAIVVYLQKVKTKGMYMELYYCLLNLLLFCQILLHFVLSVIVY